MKLLFVTWDGVRRQDLQVYAPLLWRECRGDDSPWVADEARARGFVHLTLENPAHISAPGYLELLTHQSPDAKLSNSAPPHPYPTLFLQPDRVRAYSSWRVLPHLWNIRNSNPGHATQPDAEVVDALKRDLARGALDDVDVLVLNLGDPDEHAHKGKHRAYGEAISRCDTITFAVWHLLRSMQSDHLTLLVATDHGRGETDATVQDHGPGIPGSEQTWIAAILAQPVRLRAPLTVKSTMQTLIPQSLCVVLGNARDLPLKRGSTRDDDDEQKTSPQLPRFRARRHLPRGSTHLLT